MLSLTLLENRIGPTVENVRKGKFGVLKKCFFSETDGVAEEVSQFWSALPN